MIHRALGRPIPIELTGDRHIQARVARLSVVSLVALGLVAVLAAATTGAPPALVASLGVGWLLMPTVLTWSLRVPAARYLLVLPSAFVSIGLLAVCIGWLPASTAVAAGWLLMAGGVGLGAVCGMWFWFRLAPVPAALEDPLSPGRWTLIAIHVTLVIGGISLASTALLD